MKETLDDWTLADKIIACEFDTTSSNSGVHKGAFTLLQQLLQKQILWLDYLIEKEILLYFINTLLEPYNVKKLPICDYKEFLELGKVVFGDSGKRTTSPPSRDLAQM